MIYHPFKNAQHSHEHSLRTLNALYEYDDFMESVATVIDLGAGPEGLDIEWWATRTTRDDDPKPLNIKCTAQDKIDRCSATRLRNVDYLRGDFENLPREHPPYDVLWCHDAFQYATNPFKTLSRWRNLCNDNGMLVLIVPQTTDIVHNRLVIESWDHAYYHYTVPNLMIMLAMTGWDCGAGFFKKDPDDAWIHAVVYKSQQSPRDLNNTRLYDLVDSGLLPESANQSILKSGRLKQQDLVLPWIDKSLTYLGNH